MYTVLLVDDDKVVLNAITECIDWNKYDISNVILAKNGREAVEKIMQYRPQIVITDIKMPQIDGFELVRLINEMETQISVVVISGFDDFNYARNMFKNGVVDYLLKPVSIEEIEICLTTVIKQLNTKNRVSDENFPHIDLKNDSDKTKTSYSNLIISFLKANLYRPITLNDIASSVHLTASYAASVFKIETGDTIFNYLLMLRINKAKELLTTTQMHICDISKLVGYDSPKYFTQSFKKETGLTAKEYRLQNYI